MDVHQIEALQPELQRYLNRFGDCFGRPEPAAHLDSYVRGQLSDLPRKSIEPIALHANTPPRTLQQFFSRARWDEDQMRNRLQQTVAQEHGHQQAIGIFDETSFAKKGQKSPGVQRQYCGSTGKIDNCTVTIHLSYATPSGLRVLLDGELFLPESWDSDPQRRKEAGIPDWMHHRPRWQIALELLQRSRNNGIVLPWVTFDENYGMVKQFLFDLDACGQRFAGEVPRGMHGWCKRPQVADQPQNQDRGWRWLQEHSPPPSSVENLAWHSPSFTAQSWQVFHVKDSTKGPIVWRAKFAPFHLRQDDGRPSKALWLVLAQNVLDEQQVKYFVSNAAPGTPAEAVLGVCLGRYPIERCFEDDKGELGLGDFEVRTYCSLKRHLIVTCLSSLFLARVQQSRRGEKSAPDDLPGPLGSQWDDRFPFDVWSEAATIPAAAV